MKLSELQHKEIINVTDGKNMGNIVDVSLSNDGNMTGLVIEKKRFFLSWFTSKNEIEIKWGQIEKIGEDVILVNIVF